MLTYKPYLVVWRLGTNEQSITHTPLDVPIHEDDNAQERLDAIKNELDLKNGKSYERIVILSVCAL